MYKGMHHMGFHYEYKQHHILGMYHLSLSMLEMAFQTVLTVEEYDLIMLGAYNILSSKFCTRFSITIKI